MYYQCFHIRYICTKYLKSKHHVQRKIFIDSPTQNQHVDLNVHNCTMTFREQLIQGNGGKLLINQALTLCDLREALRACKSGSSVIFTAQQNTHLSMYGQDVLCGISKGTIYVLVTFCMKLLANYLKTNFVMDMFISSSKSLVVVLHCNTVTHATKLVWFVQTFAVIITVYESEIVSTPNLNRNRNHWQISHTYEWTRGNLCKNSDLYDYPWVPASFRQASRKAQRTATED